VTPPHATFLVRLEAAPDVDGDRALRALLKRALRDFGLRCTGLAQPPRSAATAAEHPDAWRNAGCDRARHKEGNGKMADMSQYAGSTFVKVDDVRAKSIVGKIKRVEIGKFDKPLCTLETGEQLSLNATNCRTLLNAFGRDSREWIGGEIELYAGETTFNNEPRESVLVRPRSAPPPRPKPSRSSDMDDEIPF
jgi:hypothetical protein